MIRFLLGCLLLFFCIKFWIAYRKPNSINEAKDKLETLKIKEKELTWINRVLKQFKVVERKRKSIDEDKYDDIFRKQ